MSTNVTASTKGSTRYVTPGGNQRWIAANSTRPTVTMPQNAVSASDGDGRGGAELARHVELGPVAVHRLADAVEDGEAGEHPEPRRDPARRGLRAGRRGLRRAAAGGG